MVNEKGAEVRSPGPGRALLPAAAGGGPVPLARLLEGAQARDPTAQEELLSRFTPLIRAHLRRYAGGPGLDPDDLLGEAIWLFLDLVQRFDSARGIDFPGYIQRMLPWALSHYVRRQRAPENSQASPPAPAPGVGGPADAWLWEEQVVERLCLRDALARLAPQQRQVLVLAFFGDYTQEEIAAKLGITQQTVSTLRKQALQRMRKMLQDF